MEYDFHFIGAKIPVTIYQTGTVRFSREAVKEYGLENARLRWGVDTKHHVLAFKKDSLGRKVSGKNQFTTSCPLELAREFVGKFTIELNGEAYVLHRISTE